MSALNIPKETLACMRAELPSGSINEIARRSGFSVPYTSLVMNGHRPVNITNVTIIHEAQSIIRKCRQISNKINN